MTVTTAFLVLQIDILTRWILIARMVIPKTGIVVLLYIKQILVSYL